MSIGGLVPWTDVINGAAGRRCIGTLVLAPLQRSYTRTLLQDPTPSEELPSISMRAKEPWRAVLVSACMCLGESLLGPVIEDMLAWAWDCYSERSLWGAALSAGLMGACLLGPLDSVRTR